MMKFDYTDIVHRIVFVSCSVPWLGFVCVGGDLLRGFIEIYTAHNEQLVL